MRRPSTYILAGGYDRARAEHDLEERLGDLVAFRRPYLASPDLVARMKSAIALAEADMERGVLAGRGGLHGFSRGHLRPAAALRALPADPRSP